MCTFLHCLFHGAQKIRMLAILNSVSILNYSHPCIWRVSVSVCVCVFACVSILFCPKIDLSFSVVSEPIKLKLAGEIEYIHISIYYWL